LVDNFVVKKQELESGQEASADAIISAVVTAVEMSFVVVEQAADAVVVEQAAAAGVVGQAVAAGVVGQSVVDTAVVVDAVVVVTSDVDVVITSVEV
jgi:rhamnogalacturonyl hydrolase YesR